jgi:hypothetical protein
MAGRPDSALDLSRRLNALCTDHGRRLADLHRSCATAANARDVYAAQQAYLTAQESLRFAEAACAQVLGWLSGRPAPEKDPAPEAPPPRGDEAEKP